VSQERRSRRRTREKTTKEHLQRCHLGACDLENFGVGDCFNERIARRSCQKTCSTQPTDTKTAAGVSHAATKTAAGGFWSMRSRCLLATTIRGLHESVARWGTYVANNIACLQECNFLSARHLVRRVAEVPGQLVPSVFKQHVP
jgi:hypothetical protein